MMTMARLLILSALALFSAMVQAGDVERFLALDRESLRAAERRLPELYDRSTGQVLTRPRNEAERYVIEREQRWYSRHQREPRVRLRKDGVAILEYAPAMMSTTWLVMDESGRPAIHCDATSRHFPVRNLPRRDAEPRAVVR